MECGQRPAATTIEMDSAEDPGDDCQTSGDPAELVTQVYAELRAVAAGFMRRERPGHTLQPTALVHEMYLRLAEQERVRWNGPVHFRAVASLAIRRFLTDHARRCMAEQRGANWSRITLDENRVGFAPDPATLLAVDEALERLRERDERQARVVELRFFGGLTIDEAAEVLDVSPSTVDGDWRMARAWLRRELEGSEE